MLICKKFGFTLIEVLVSLTIALVLIWFTLIPTSKNYLPLIIEELQTAIIFAKAEAMIRRTPVLLLPKDPKNWLAGMVLLVHENQILYSWQWRFKDYRILWQGLNGSKGLKITPDLQHRALSGAFIIFHHENPIGKIIINRLGRINLLTNH